MFPYYTMTSNYLADRPRAPTSEQVTAFEADGPSPQDAQSQSQRHQSQCQQVGHLQTGRCRRNYAFYGWVRLRLHSTKNAKHAMTENNHNVPGFMFACTTEGNCII